MSTPATLNRAPPARLRALADGAAGAHAVRGAAGVAGPRGRRGARAGVLVRARSPLRACLALLAWQRAAHGPWGRAVVRRHVLLRIRALGLFEMSNLADSGSGRRCFTEYIAPARLYHKHMLAAGQSMRGGASTAPGVSAQNMTQAHQRSREAGGQARGGATGQCRPALRGRAGSLRALDVRAASRPEGRAPEGQRQEAPGLERPGPRLLRRSTG